MDGATLQGKIYRGYAKAAKVIGQSFNLYRPLSASTPLGNQVGTVMAALDSGPAYDFKSPNEYGDPTWFALVDDATTQAGDYLINSTGTYFIAGKQFLLPVIAVECNRTVKISRGQAVSAVGALGYGGMTPSTQQDVLGAPGALWPASVLFGGKQERDQSGLPAGVPLAGWQILLPPSVPITIKASDIVTDDLGRRYAINGAELTDLGWRIKAVEEHA